MKITVKFRIAGTRVVTPTARGYVVINMALIAFGSKGNPIFMTLLMYDMRTVGLRSETVDLRDDKRRTGKKGKTFPF